MEKRRIVSSRNVLVLLTVILLALFCGVLLSPPELPYDYVVGKKVKLLETDADQQLVYQASAAENLCVVVVADADGQVGCGLLEKGWGGYRHVRSCGWGETENLRETGLYCWSLLDEGEGKWFEWGILPAGKNITIPGQNTLTVVEIALAGQLYNLYYCIGYGNISSPERVVT